MARRIKPTRRAYGEDQQEETGERARDSNGDYLRLLEALTAIDNGVAVHECSPGVIAEAIIARYRLLPRGEGRDAYDAGHRDGYREGPSMQPSDGRDA